MQIDKLARYNTLAVLRELPSTEYLLYYLTDDQKDHWWILKRQYTLLFQSFQEYFSGQAESQFYELDKNEREFYISFRDFYLAFYTLIQFKWKDIEEVFQSRGLDLTGFASCPGEALIRVMENDCHAFFLNCLLPYYKWTPHQARKLAKEDREIQQALNQNYGQLNPQLKHKIKTYQRELDNLSSG